LREFILRFKKENVSYDEFIKYLDEVYKPKIVEKPAELIIPASVFDNSRLSALEAVVKYLHENKGLRLVELAKLLKRDQRAIGVTYRFARKKMKPLLKVYASKYSVPASVIAERKLSVLESVVYHLKKNYGLRYCDIALMLRRDDRTVWTVYDRALNKGGMKKRKVYKRALPLKKMGLKEHLSLFKKKKIDYADFIKCLDEVYKQHVLLAKPEEVDIPVSVFSNDCLSALEAIVKYLHENKGFRLVEVARFIRRDQRAIGVTYRFARKKMKVVLKTPVSKYKLPVSVIADRKMSVLENTVYHLKKTYNLSYHNIAIIIRRDDRTVWTVYDRALKKLKNRKI